VIVSPRLCITGSGRSERTVDLQDTVTIGRADDNDIVLEDAAVSRCHVLLMIRSEGVVLVDMDSTNGTFVNGRPAPSGEHVHLADGDVIVVGATALRYEASPAISPEALRN
jgi:ABC transport system ATP-binding/permease protein